MRAMLWISLLLFAGIALVLLYMVKMPGDSRPHSPVEISPTLTEALRSHVRRLSHEIGPRSMMRIKGLRAAADYIESELVRAGYLPTRHLFTVGNQTVDNLSAEAPGSGDGVLIIGAHYDSVGDKCPAADDNASGVAAVLELAKALKAAPLRVSVRFLFFVNEEPPYFQTDMMGSLVYARALKESGAHVLGMLSVESIGYYNDKPGSQIYPTPFRYFYPERGDFVAFVSNLRSGLFLRDIIGRFRGSATIASEGLSAPGFVAGIEWSDHWAFSSQGFPALMVTDTAPFRFPYYHTEEDTFEKLDYEKMARVTAGLEAAIRSIAGQ